MKVVNGEKFLTIGEVGEKIDRLPQTIKRWYDWWKKQDLAIRQKYPLPAEYRVLDRKGTRYYREEDLDKLIAFRDNLEYGIMSDFNIQFWGKKGKEIIQKRKEEKEVEGD